MKRIEKFFQDLDKEVNSIRDNTKGLMDIAQQCKDLEDTFKIIVKPVIFGNILLVEIFCSLLKLWEWNPNR